MKLLNRSAFAVLPRQPFADWANGLPDSDELNHRLTLEEHRREGTVYLIGEVASEADLEQALAQHWHSIFENELAAWDEMADHWPDPLSFELFQSWFEATPQVMVIDLERAPIMTAMLDE